MAEPGPTNLAQDIVRSMTDPELIAPFFRPPESWSRWLTVLRCLFGLPLSADEVPLFRRWREKPSPRR